MIVFDGHTDPEKLRQLLTAAEETHLDFKACLDFQKTKDRVEFVKDAVTLANRPPGGYIVMGIDDNGNPCIPAGTVVNPRQFDGASLNQHVRRFIEGEAQIVSQIHQIDGHDYVLVWIPHHRDGLPVPMKATGQYRDDNGKDKVVFHEGDILCAALKSGDQGGVTKTGNSHARRLLIEAAWHHRPPYRPGRHLRRRWETASPAARGRGQAANRRLHARWARFDERKKRSVIANAAIARELAGWCWSLAVLDE
jgi:hypothetical protein